MSRVREGLAALCVAFGLFGCAPNPTPADASSPPLAADFPVECGPIQDAALCQKAVAVAATAKTNPPRIVAASIRRPREDDDCVDAFHACGPESIVVVIQSGDTLQEIPLVRTSDGWVRLDLVR
jgi:hypothetical protein